MATMSDVAQANLRAALEQERDDLRNQLNELGGLNYDSNFADSSQVTAERGEAEALAAKLKETLDEVEHALEKHDEGTYGTCEGCGEPIAPARLEAMPATRFCINCASAKR
jgi:DnaK suppressor protein